MLIARQASASMQGLYNTGSVARTNWLGVMNYSGTATVFTSVQTISVGDYVYSVGNKTVGGISTGVIIKFSTSGTAVWEKVISLTGVNVRLNCITSDTDGNIYVVTVVAMLLLGLNLIMQAQYYGVNQLHQLC